jgi:hypothetical protein
MKADIQSVKGVDGIYVARLAKLSCTALRLRDGSLCLYNPVAGMETALTQSPHELGDVSALLAPNHYHNKGLKAHVEAFPNATLYCSATAKPRLTKLTGLTFDGLDRLREKLPDGSDLCEPDGLNTGEVWLQVRSRTDCALAVTDAFNAALRPPGVYADQAGLLGTFPRYGIKDAAAYRTWVTEFLATASPSILLPCHGSPVKSEDLTAQLIGLVEDAF